MKSACACKHGFPAIGLGGVSSWQSRKKGYALIPDFDYLNWDEREVTIIFDSDLKDNLNVSKALYGLAKKLVSLGANVKVGQIEAPEGEKWGIDDLILNEGPKALEEVIFNGSEFLHGAELHRLNSEVAYIKNPGLIVNLDSGFKMRASDFSGHAYSDRSCIIKNAKGDWVEAPATREWLKWPSRLVLEKIDYKPGEPTITEEGNYNAWKNWGCIPKPGSIKLWREYMDRVFGGDRKSRKWFEQWCAIQFQQPGIKLYTACLFWSRFEGVGKSFLGLSLGEIFGENFVELNQTHLFAQHNEWAENKQFALGDEITGRDSHDSMDLLNAMITRKTLHINIKYVPSYEMRDCINYLFTSNHPNAFHVNEMNRRMFIWELTEKPEDTEEFFQRYDEWIYGEGKAALFSYFLSLDISGFNPKSEAPMTGAKEKMIDVAESDIERWVRNLLESPDTTLTLDRVPLPGALWTSEDLRNVYDPLGQTRMTAKALGRALTKKGVPQAPKTRMPDGRSVRPYVVRDPDTWLDATHKQRVDHYEKTRLKSNKKFT